VCVVWTLVLIDICVLRFVLSSGNEAPPAIISAFVGSELNEVGGAIAFECEMCGSLFV